MATMQSSSLAPRPALLLPDTRHIAPSYVNPSQTQSAQAGPSNFMASAPLKKKTGSLPKRKRTDTPDGSTDSAATQRPNQKNGDAPRKKKANRACFHCQKAHLTCDDSRPCQRCVKRGMADTCTEGHRKKAKYLLDEDELESLKRNKSSAPETKPEPRSQPPPPPPPQAPTDPFPQHDAFLSVPFDAGFSFGSEAANLEYSILSAILGNPSPPEDTLGTPPPASSQTQQQYPSTLTNAAWPAEFGSNNDFSGAYTIQPEDTLNSSFMNAYPSPQYQSATYSQQYRSQPQQPQQQQQLKSLQPRFHSDSNQSTSFSRPIVKARSESTALATPPASTASPKSMDSAPLSAITDPLLPHGSQLQSINDRVTAPYDYTEGYHFIMKFLPSRFEKNDILRIVRALAIIRPSLIALQMPLSVDDEVFVEKCFQRSLLELDKLISFSGTPTVAWRRTGEVCLVSPEFCELSGWAMEELVGRRKYIYELFENQSVVEYWESFASHAFENTTQSVYSHCVLLKPSGAPVPATFCFSIRRDLFDLPSVVIGQWLPLL